MCELYLNKTDRNRVQTWTWNVCVAVSSLVQTQSTTQLINYLILLHPSSIMNEALERQV